MNASHKKMKQTIKLKNKIVLNNITGEAKDKLLLTARLSRACNKAIKSSSKDDEGDRVEKSSKPRM